MTNYNAKCLVPLEAPTDALQYAINRTAREVVDRVIGEIRSKGGCIIRMEERQYDEQMMNSIAVYCRIDIDELVRCKDCKYSFYDKDYENYNCRKHEYVECFDADDYCSWGERND